jgi:hypothetical protein
VLGRLPDGWRGIVVDNGSTDGSADVAREHGALVVEEARRGFGAAAHAGLEAATAPFVAFCDADASMDPADLPILAAPVFAGDAELVLGRRRPTTRGAWPFHARVANLALAHLMRRASSTTRAPCSRATSAEPSVDPLSTTMRRASGVALHDLGPMRVASREGLLGLGLADRRSGYPLEMVLRASEAGWRIVELDVPYAPRVGRSKVTGTVKGTARAVGDMSRLLREAGR